MSTKNKKGEKIVTPPKVLVDNTMINLQLVESKTGKLIVRGEFAKCGVATENKRVYPENLWESQIKRLASGIKDRKILGEADHPGDGQTKIQRASHLITNLYIENGIVIGEAEIVDTDQGRNLKALINAGVKVGVSSRGYGSTVENEKGEQVVQGDYRLRTFDFVADPADVDAYPTIVSESIAPDKSTLMFEGAAILDPEEEKDLADKFAATILAADKDAKIQHAVTAKEEWANLVTTMISDAKAEIREQVRSELLSDPSVGGAKAALADIVSLLKPHLLPEQTTKALETKESEINRLKKDLAERTLRVQTLEQENQGLADIARQLGYRLHVERTFNTNPLADTAREMVGNVTSFKTVEDLKNRVVFVTEELAKKVDAEKQLIESKALAEATSIAKQLEESKENFRILDEALTNSRAATKLLQEQLAVVSSEKDQLDLQLYIESQLTNNPRAIKIKKLLNDSNPKSKAQVDKILENFEEPVQQLEDYERTRSRIRSIVSGGQVARPMDEEVRVPSQKTEDLGINISQFNILAGVKAVNK